jgi:hypothetical protein
MVNYDTKPAVWSSNGNGSFTYRWGIKEVETPSFGREDEVARVSWDCDEVVIWPRVDRSKLVAAVLT